MTVEFNSEKLTAYLDRALALKKPKVLAVLLYDAAKLTGERGVQLIGGYPEASGRKLSDVYSGDELLRAYRRFFGALSKGLIKSVPYRRTGTLGKSISYRIENKRGTLEIAIGSNLASAPKVLGDPATQQARYHQGTWTPLVETISDNAGDLLGVFETKFVADLDAYMAG